MKTISPIYFPTLQADIRRDARSSEANKEKPKDKASFAKILQECLQK